MIEPEAGPVSGFVDDLLGEGAFASIAQGADRWISQQRNAIAQNARDALGGYMSSKAAEAAQIRARAVEAARARAFPTEAPRAEAPPRPTPPMPSGPTARETLGFPPQGHVTKEQIKSRRRELARMFHPDFGGSPRQMQRVNDAVAEMLAECTG